MTGPELLKEGRCVLSAEASALSVAARHLGADFLATLRILAHIRGKVITCGVGKSGLAARRLASVLSSTGTPAFFMHPVEGLHGDIGIISADDVAILMSHSGKNDELLNLIPFIKRQGAKIVIFTRNRRSPLARFSDIVLETRVNREACPFNLVPTTSTAVTSGLGDALAIALMKLKGFEQKDYQSVHPGGAIGKRLLYRVEDLMISGQKIPTVSQDDTLRDAVAEMSRKSNLGMTCVTGPGGRLVGILTDGDLRRLLETGRGELSLPVSRVMTPRPKTVPRHMLAVEALSLMERHAITCLIVTGGPGRSRIEGVLHMHSILRSGVV